MIIAGYLAGYEKRFLNILSTLLFKQEKRLLRAGEEGKIYDAEECIIAILHTEADSH